MALKKSAFNGINFLNVYFFLGSFLSAFSAALVFLASPEVFFSTSLITPTATVYFISLTANLPRGGYSANTSTHMGFVGTILTMQA